MQLNVYVIKYILLLLYTCYNICRGAICMLSGMNSAVRSQYIS